MKRGNHDRNIAPAIASRRDEGEKKLQSVKTTIDRLIAESKGHPVSISIKSVASKACVSRAFIYSHPALRAQILSVAHDGSMKSNMDETSSAVLVKALQRRIASLEKKEKESDERRKEFFEERKRWLAERDVLYARIAALEESSSR